MGVNLNAAFAYSRAWWPLILLLTFTIPALAEFFREEWSTDNQSHGPIIIAVSSYLFYFKLRGFNVESPSNLEIFYAGLLTIIGVMFLVAGRVIDLPAMSGVAVIATIATGVILSGGSAALRKTWFPIFFLLFMIPLPATVVSYLTAPLKLVVSSGAVMILSAIGEPVSRQGVTLNVGQYKLLVADACAGLNSIFTLEALGLVYLSLIESASKARTVLLTAAILPISISSNIIRVVALSLITLYLGDEAGQGFLHGFAGMLLFLIGLVLMLVVDALICRILVLLGVIKNA